MYVQEPSSRAYSQESFFFFLIWLTYLILGQCDSFSFILCCPSVIYLDLLGSSNKLSVYPFPLLLKFALENGMLVDIKQLLFLPLQQ